MDARNRSPPARGDLICAGGGIRIWVVEIGPSPIVDGRSRIVPRRLWIAALGIWPGLPQIWSGQEVLGLILATLFAATLNLAVVARFIWTESFAPGWAGFFAA